MVDKWQTLCNTTGYRPYQNLSFIIGLRPNAFKNKKTPSLFLVARYLIQICWIGDWVSSSVFSLPL